MILKIYKNKSGFISNHYFLKNTDNDNKGILGTTLKSVISEYKDTKNYMVLETIVELNFKLINCKEYNSIEELEFDYLEELI